jgi:hypothetical protein
VAALEQLLAESEAAKVRLAHSPIPPAACLALTRAFFGRLRASPPVQSGNDVDRAPGPAAVADGGASRGHATSPRGAATPRCAPNQPDRTTLHLPPSAVFML